MGSGSMNGLESMISTVLSGSSGDLKANRSVKSRRASSPGNLRLSALRWLDMVAPLLVVGGVVVLPPDWRGLGSGRDRMAWAAAACAAGRPDVGGFSCAGS